MELVELQVRHHRPGPQGESDPVAGGDLGVGRVPEELPGAAGGQDDGVRGQRGAVQQPYADRPPGVHLDIDHGGTGPQVDARLGHPAEQGRGDRLTGRISVHVQDPGVLVSGLQPEGKSAVGSGVEVDAPFGQLADGGRAALAEHCRRVHVTQSGAGHQGVGDVTGRGVLG